MREPRKWRKCQLEDAFERTLKWRSPRDSRVPHKDALRIGGKSAAIASGWRFADQYPLTADWRGRRRATATVAVAPAETCTLGHAT